MNRVLLVNHLEHNCGVYQFGERTLKRALRSSRYECSYIETNHQWEFEHWVRQIGPHIVVYNYYGGGATMGWLTPAVVNNNRARFKQLSLYHEGNLGHMGFDLLIHQDPTNTDLRFMNISRPIPEYVPYLPAPEVPTFGSFGFGLGGKGFDRLVNRVCEEYDTAVIRLVIPFAAFGDSSGDGARRWAHLCRQRITKPGIRSELDHTLLSTGELLDWLAGNTANCFLYDENYGRGLSGTTDYALAVGRPIAITRSHQFQHLWSESRLLLEDGRTLREIADGGIEHLKKFHDLWGGRRLTEDFDRIFDKALGV